jgi:tetratricopeptide (TPR) repeat protein
MKWVARVWKLKTRESVIVLAVILALVGGIVFYFSHRGAGSSKGISSVAQNEIRLFKNDKTIDGRRELASAYAQNGQYDSSKAEWQKIASQTNQTQDWWALLNICSGYKVGGSADCIKKSAAILKSRAGSLDFQTAYAIGSQLETSHNGKLALPFYSRALKVYNPPQDSAVNYLSKEQLQEKINELNK